MIDFPSIYELITQGVSKEKIGCLLRDIWQLQTDEQLLSIAHDVLVNPSFDLHSKLHQMQNNIEEFHETWIRCVKAFELSFEWARLYSIMEGIFRVELKDMESLNNPNERLPLYINLQGKCICSFYNYNRSIVLANIGLTSKENTINNYKEIRDDFRLKIHMFQSFRSMYINTFSDDYKALVMSLDSLFDETANEINDAEIVNYIS